MNAENGQKGYDSLLAAKHNNPSKRVVETNL